MRLIFSSSSDFFAFIKYLSSVCSLSFSLCSSLPASLLFWDLVSVVFLKGSSLSFPESVYYNANIVFNIIAV